MSKTERALDRALDDHEDDHERDEIDTAEPEAAPDVDAALGVDVDLDDVDFHEYEDDEDDEPYELPPILIATEEEEPEAGADPLIARGPIEPEVSDDVLDELRRAEIDGPTVEFAPQDDSSSAMRRPRRSAEFDATSIRGACSRSLSWRTSCCT